jgi:hemoglobin-like flavoprotein
MTKDRQSLGFRHSELTRHSGFNIRHFPLSLGATRRRITLWGMIQRQQGFPMTEASVQRIAANYELLAPRMQALTDAFYVRLFEVMPEARPLFRIDIALQSQHLAAALALIVRNLRLMDALEQPLMELGEHHARVGVRPEQYPILIRTMVATLREHSGDAWSPQLEADWTAALELVGRIMMEGALRLATAESRRAEQPS